MSINEELYAELEKLEAKVREALQDSRYGEDAEFTMQTSSLKTFTLNLRNRLRDSANHILIANNKELKGFLEAMGIHADKMQDLRDDAQLAEAIGVTIERTVKLAHPLL